MMAPPAEYDEGPLSLPYPTDIHWSWAEWGPPEELGPLHHRDSRGLRCAPDVLVEDVFDVSYLLAEFRVVWWLGQQ